LLKIGQNLNSDVEAFFSFLLQHFSVLSFEQFVGAVVLKFLVELERDAHVDLRLVAVAGVRNAVKDAIKVGLNV
jgi:hypothetical protein